MSKISIINQHGSNRGDEAACRAMLYGLKRFIPDAEFTVLTVYPLSLDGVPNVTLMENLPLRGLSKSEMVRRLLKYTGGFYTRFRLTPHQARVYAAYRQADLILSAPGGPYIGDLYKRTEPELLLHLTLATLTSSPVMIYAPSMGPFRHKMLNLWRKQVLRRVDLITVREAISARYLSELGIHIPEQYITIDSALQRPVDVEPGDRVFREMGLDRHKVYIGFVPLELDRFKSDDQKIKYIELLVRALHALVDRFDADLVFFPQGYGAWHDRPFIESLISIARLQHRAHILPESYNSDQQQALIGKMSGMVSFRYHPGIFALRQFVPCVNVAYEHKVRGFMQSLGVEEFCLDLATLTAEGLVDKLAEVWQEGPALERRIRPRLEELERLSLKNSFLAALLLKHRSSARSVPLNAFIEQQLAAGEWWKP